MGPALAGRGHDVHVLSCSWDEDGARDYQERGVSVHVRPRLSVRGLGLLRAPLTAARIGLAFSCLKWLRELDEDFDLVEAPDYMAEGSLIALRTSIPVLLHAHSGIRTVLSDSGERLGWDAWLSDRLEHSVTRMTPLVTSPSRMLLRDLRQAGWLHRKVRSAVVRYPIDLEPWQQAGDVLSTDPVVLFSGRLESRKSPETIIHALALLRDIPNTSGVFVGASTPDTAGQDYAGGLRALANDLQVQCEFFPHVARHELVRHYTQARVAAVPSRFDNFPMAALEAMAARRPLICTARTGTAELLLEAQPQNVVPPGDPHALARALRPYLEDPMLAAERGQAAFDLVVTHCKPESIAQARERIYEQVIAGGGAELVGSDLI